jgi:hypothetical protein
MAIKKPSAAMQLRFAKKEMARLEEENADLRRSWMEELTARSKNGRELEVAYARCIKLQGVIEYLEEKVKDA